MLVIPEADFKRLAELSHHEGRPIYAARFGMHPRERSRLFPFLIPSDQLAERFGVSLAIAPASPAPPMRRGDLGFLGEMEVVRLLAEDASELNLFRPFPDLETSELAVLHLTSRRTIGLQVKTISVDSAHPAGTVTIHAASFRPSPTTSFVCLAWLREEHRFHGECLFIPSEAIREICAPSARDGHLHFDWHPGSTAASRLQDYRTLTPRLASGLAADA